jgi:hypothetical protein
VSTLWVPIDSTLAFGKAATAAAALTGAVTLIPAGGKGAKAATGGGASSGGDAKPEKSAVGVTVADVSGKKLAARGAEMTGSERF